MDGPTPEEGVRLLRRAAFLDASSLVVPDEAVGFSFAIDGEGVTLVGHDPAIGLPTVHAESDHPAARAWIEGEYERIRADAEPVHVDEHPSSGE